MKAHICETFLSGGVYRICVYIRNNSINIYAIPTTFHLNMFLFSFDYLETFEKMYKIYGFVLSIIAIQSLLKYIVIY